MCADVRKHPPGFGRMDLPGNLMTAGWPLPMRSHVLASSSHWRSPRHLGTMALAGRAYAWVRIETPGTSLLPSFCASSADRELGRVHADALGHAH